MKPTISSPAVLRRLVCLALLLTPMALPNNVWAQKVLRWKFTPGQQLNQVLTQDVNLTMTVQGNAIKMSMTQSVDTLWKVNKVDDEGVAELTQTITRVRMSMRGPVGNFDIDTSAEKSPEEGMGKQLADALNALVNKSFQLQMNGQGKVLSVTVPEEMTKALQSTPGGDQLANTFSEEGLKNMITQGTPSFPKEAISKGATWTSEFSMKIPPAGTMGVVSTFTYAGEEDGNPPLDKLDVKLKQTVKTDEDGQFQITMKDQKTDGAIYFDSQAGRMVRSEIKQEMTMEIVAGGQTIDQQLGQTIKVTFAPVK